MDESVAVADLLDLPFDDLPKILQSVVNLSRPHARIIEIMADVRLDVILKRPLIGENPRITHELASFFLSASLASPWRAIVRAFSTHLKQKV